MSALIQTKRISKIYRMGGDVLYALREVSVSIAQGEFVAIMGASGSGKSTLMNILGCLDVPSEGEYFFQGQAVHRMTGDELAKIRNLHIGFVFQQFHLLGRTTALENVELPMLYAGVNSAERKRRAKAALEKVGLGGRLDHTRAELSGGQQQRVAIARALVNNPQLILADEPTGALDSKTSEDTMRLLKNLNEAGMTLVLVTHDAQVAQWAKRKIVFSDGQVLSDQVITFENPERGLKKDKTFFQETEQSSKRASLSPSIALNPANVSALAVVPQ